MPRVHDDILGSVIYLYPSVQAANEDAEEGGTGFLVEVPSSFTEEYRYLYAVTASHVVKEGRCLTIRLNTRGGKAEAVELTEDDWISHPDGDDIAIAPLGLAPRHFRYFAIPDDAIVRDWVLKEHRVGPGDDVFYITRLKHQRFDRNEPTLRFGTLAMFPDQPINHESRGINQASYLVEARSLSGYSGSPVFVYRKPGPWIGGSAGFLVDHGEEVRPTLLGVDWCHFWDYEQVRDRDKEPMPDSMYVRQNSGLMGVVPSTKLVDLLDAHIGERERAEEEEMNRKRNESSGAEPDIAIRPETLTKQDFEEALRRATRRIPEPKREPPPERGKR